MIPCGHETKMPAKPLPKTANARACFGSRLGKFDCAEMARIVSRSGPVSGAASGVNPETSRSSLAKMLARTFDITPPLPRPPGLLARTNHKCAVWAIGLLDIKPNDKVLEVGFGPGLGIQFAAGLTSRDMWLASIR
jgi:hypothetical protein